MLNIEIIIDKEKQIVTIGNEYSSGMRFHYNSEKELITIINSYIEDELESD